MMAMLTRRVRIPMTVFLLLPLLPLLSGWLYGVTAAETNLAVSSFSLSSSSIMSGTSVTAKLAIVNIGKRAATSTSVAFWVVPLGQSLASPYSSRAAETSLGTLQPGKTFTVVSTIPLSASLPSGTYQVVAQLKTAKRETSTIENTASVALLVDSPTSTSLTTSTSSTHASSTTTSTSLATSTSSTDGLSTTSTQTTSTATSTSGDTGTGSSTSTPTTSTTSSTTTTAASAACDYYAAPNGGGNGTASSPFTIQKFWAVAAPGKTLCLLDGTYQGSSNLIQPPQSLSGTSSAPIVIRAYNDGGALIDGQFVSPPIALSRNSYFVIQGLNAKSGSYSVIRLGEKSNNNVLRRIVAWDALFEDMAGGHTNGEIIGIHDSTYNLVEDVGAFGMGRKLVNATQGGNDNTFRRIWIRVEGSADKPVAALSLGYNNYRGLWENVLATWNQDYMPQQYFSSQDGVTRTNYQIGTTHGLFAVDILYGDICANTKLLGSLAYLPSRARISTANEPRLTWLRRMGCLSVRDVASVVDPAHGSFNSVRALAFENTEGLGTATNLSASNLTSQHGSLNDIFATPPWEVNNASVSSGSTITVSPWTSTTLGANLCSRYVNGVKTTTPLWPWPMNERIKQATAVAGIYSGYCNSCSGGRAARTATDVMQDIQALLGPIPAQCRAN
jgi:hypothetical protein